MGNDETEMKIEVGDYDFEERVIEKSKQIPVIVDFWAQWCMPCLVLGPVLEKITNEDKGKFILAKLNVDKNPVTSQRYGIRSIPAVKIFKDGEIVTEFIGAVSESQVREYLNKI